MMRNRYKAEVMFSKHHRYMISSTMLGAGRAGFMWACVMMTIGFLAYPVGSKSQNAVQPPAFLIKSGKAGPFELGATVEEIYNLVGRDRVRLVDLFAEGLFTPALEIQAPGINGEPTIVAHIREWPCAQFSVWGILVRDQRFRTQEGIGIGSSLSEVRRRYQVKMMSGEGSEVAFVPSLNLSFVLDAVSAPADLSKVKSIWIPPQPQEVRKRRCPQLRP